MGIYLEKKTNLSLSALEEKYPLKASTKNCTIGVPYEKDENETRVGLIPEVVTLLVKNGYKVVVESNAGKAAKISNLEYSEAGAEICENANEVFQADIIFKIQPPTISEIEWMKNNSILFSIVHVCLQNIEFYKALMRKKITGFGYELIKDECGGFSFLKAMSQITGKTSALIASEYLCHPKYGNGSILGAVTGVPPSKVIIIGAGTVAKHAAHSFLCLGCEVTIFDNSMHRLNRIQELLHTSISTSILYPEKLEEYVLEADVVVAALYSKTGISPCIITEEMVKKMKQGSIIVDISIDQGGCVETSIPTTQKNPVFVKHGISHYCVPNVTARFPYTASYALSNLLIPVLENFSVSGDLDNLLRMQYGLRNGVYLYHGILTNPIIGNQFQMNYQDINVLFDTRLG